MTQILNILRKDVRHLRFEILASVTVLVLFILVEPRTWMTMYSTVTNTAQVTAFLVCVSWGILIFRLVHAERLAGLNQFWTTRPYEWPKLLAAKALFIVLFVYTPFVLAQFYLLHHAGFGVTANLSPMLHNLALLTCVLILPLVCIAVVTTSFGQAALTILGMLVAFIGLLSLSSYIGSINATFGLPRHAPLFTLPLELGIALLFFAAAILLQYSRRVTLKSIAVLGTAAAVLLLTPQLLEGGTTAAAGYAAVPDAPASVTIDTTKKQSFSVWLPKNPRTAMYDIPLRFADYAAGATFNSEAERYTLTTADGYTWTSDWLDYRTDFSYLLPKDWEAAAHTRAFIDIPWRIVPRVVGRPVSIRIEFIFDQLASAAPYTYSLPTDAHAVPGLGVCALDDGEDNIYCRAPLGDFNFVNVSTTGSPDPCDASPDTPPIVAPPIPVTGFPGRPQAPARESVALHQPGINQRTSSLRAKPSANGQPLPRHARHLRRQTLPAPHLPRDPTRHHHPQRPTRRRPSRPLAR